MSIALPSLRALGLSALLLLGACGGQPQEQPLQPGECADNSSCEGMQACIGGTCEEVSCLANSDCPLGRYCDVEGDYTCVEGCSEDSDCRSGEACNEAGSCEPAACEDQDVDCGIGEHCTDGDCVLVDGFCDPCEDDGQCLEGLACKYFDKEKVSACLPTCTPTPDPDDSTCPARTICFAEGGGSSGVCEAGCPDLWAIGAF